MVRCTVTSYGTGPATIDGCNGGAIQCSHLIVKDLVFVGSGRKAGNTETGVSAIDCDDVKFTNIDVSGFQKSGLSAEGSRGVRITHAHVHDNKSALGAREGDGLNISTSPIASPITTPAIPQTSPTTAETASSSANSRTP